MEQPDDANFDDATLGVVSRYILHALRFYFFAFISSRRRRRHQAFFEWFWCLIFPFFLFKNSNFENVRALLCRLVSFISTER